MIDPIHEQCGYEVGDSGSPFTGPFPKPLDRPLTDEDLAAWMEEDDRWCKELSAMTKAVPLGEPDQLPTPEIVRDVRRDWAANTCCECQKSLEHEITVHIHAGNAYCGRCYHAENA